MSLSPYSNHSAKSSTHAEGAATNCVPRIKQPILLVLDFDGTLTRKDTLQLVAEVGYSHQRVAGTSPQPQRWPDIVDAYLADLKTFTAEYQPKASDRTSVDQELAWLNSLQAIEDASFQRALSAGIFDGLPRTEMQRAGELAQQQEQVILRTGWDELNAWVRDHNAKFPSVHLPVSILSVNWSAAFISGVLRQASKQQRTNRAHTDDWKIHANEVASICVGSNIAGGNKGVPAEVSMPIHTSGAKVRLLQSFRDRMGDKENPILLTYVGDSTTDLGCLLAADVGFCIRDHPMASSQQELATTCERIGVEVRPIDRVLSVASEASKNSREHKTIWWAKDLAEIAHWLNMLVHT